MWSELIQCLLKIIVVNGFFARGTKYAIKTRTITTTSTATRKSIFLTCAIPDWFYWICCFKASKWERRSLLRFLSFDSYYFCSCTLQLCIYSLQLPLQMRSVKKKCTRLQCLVKSKRLINWKTGNKALARVVSTMISVNATLIRFHRCAKSHTRTFTLFCFVLSYFTHSLLLSMCLF